MKNFRDKLHSALKSKGMTQEELCRDKRIDMTSTGFGRKIDKNNLTVKELEDICEILDVPLNYFLEFDLSAHKPESFWKRLVDDLTNEVKDYRMKCYQYQEQIANFLSVSRKRVVRLSFSFFLCPFLTILLTNTSSCL